jgi:hypothetical protein
MGRGYTRKTSCGQFAPKDMEAAVKLVIDDNYSYKAASERFANIDIKTLWR